MKKRLNKTLFSKFYWGIADESEKKEVFDSEESQSMLNEDWDKSADTGNLNHEINHEKITSGLNKRILQSKTSKGKVRRLNIFISRYAAAILIPIIAIGAIYYLMVFRPNMINNIAMIEKYNPKGQRSELMLPDGSKIWLNADSKITYPEKFIGRNRTVYLEGEAFFKVTHNERKPFIVKTSDLDIEVLGTTFNVESYANDKTVETTLVTGKVSVKRLNPETKKYQRAILTPNHQAIFYKEDETFILDKTDVTKYTSWKNGVLVFDNEPIESLVHSLERWYNVDFIIDSQNSIVNSYRYTLTITDESIDEVLVLLKKSTPKLNIVNNGSKIKVNQN